MLAFHHFTMATAELFLWLIIGNGEGGGKKILQPSWYTVVWPLCRGEMDGSPAGCCQLWQLCQLDGQVHMLWLWVTFDLRFASMCMCEKETETLFTALIFI